MALKSKEWAAIRALFEQTDMPVASIADSHNISRPAIDKRAAKEKWTINPAREELRARRAGGSLTGDKPNSAIADAAPSEKMLTDPDYAKARTIYEGGVKKIATVEHVAGVIGVTVADIDFRMQADKEAGNPWLRRGEVVERGAAPSGAVYDGVAMRPAEPEPEPERERVEPDLTRVRSPIRKLSRRDEKPIEFAAARKIKHETLINIMRDAGEALVCQVRDAIANRDTLMDMLEEWNRDNADDERRSEKYAAMKKALSLKELSLAYKNATTALKSVVEQDEARAGKKDRQKEDARDLANDEGNPFSKRRMPPRLAAADGKPV